MSDTGCADPFGDEAFRADLDVLAASARQSWQRWAADCVVLSRLAAQVPREPDNRLGELAWKSFVREIAVLRHCSDQAAGKDIYLAVALTTSYPRTLALLQTGELPRWQAQVLIEESAGCDPAVIGAVDTELAERAARMNTTRLREAVRKIELRHDGDAAAARSAQAATARGTRLLAQPDGQAELTLTGPALPVLAFYESISTAARAAKAAGDPRGLDALRFDIAVDVTSVEDPAPDSAIESPTDPASQPAGPQAPADAGWEGDRRKARPVQVIVHLPVTTALGLDNEPGFIAGYGWVNAPQCRQWLTSAELRQACVSHTGQVLDLSDRAVRPTPTPTGVRTALLDMVRDPGPISPKTYREEPRHDPSPALAEFVDIRDLFCDGPTGTRIPAPRADKDHEHPYPAGPTAAYNLTARGRRTHQLKHHGWIPWRTATSTLWFSPAGQVVEVPRNDQPPPDLDAHASLPDADQLHEIDSYLVQPPEEHAPFDEPPPF